MGRVSPDCKWVVYSSDETGRPEIYLAPFPKGDGKWQVSTSGGAYPVWRGDSKEIFYSSISNDFYSATVAANGTDIQVGVPQLLFHEGLIGNGFPYDVSADGQHFLVDQAEEAAAAPLYLMVNWTAALKKN
jgi:eukaryotic-like serine/threonine-protein kinase